MGQLDSYRKLYFFLFGAIAEATAEMEQGRVVLAYGRLVKTQQEAEAACLEFDILPEQ